MAVSEGPVVKAARYSRNHHRARQHESAHAAAEGEAHERILDHPMVTHAAGELIAGDAALTELAAHLRQEGSFAYDSEFIGELSYHPKLCLIQVATTKRIGLIDPLAGANLAPFWELVADRAIEKIVHAGEQDIEPVHRLTGRRAANVFDTQIAAGFAGLVYPVGLSKLVRELLGARLGKGLTFTHWDQRPLSAIQLRYAANDVRYLPAVRAVMGQRLSSLGHTAWVSEECESLCDPSRYGFDPDSYCLRIRGAGSLSPQALAVLRELTIWRDEAARAHDVPARALVRDEVLVEMSRQPVKSVDKLSRVKGLPRPVEAAHGAAMVEATLRGLAAAPTQRLLAGYTEPTPSERFHADSLFAVASALCAGQLIDPGLVTSRQEVFELHRALRRAEHAIDTPLLKGWRAEACGKQLLRLLAGEAAIELRWGDGRLHALGA